MTLYLKYRPQAISELDLEEVRGTLGKMVKGGSIPHTLLFAGPKGTGKTSAARILAKVLNCEENKEKLGEPCNKCSQCTSIIAGSNVDVVEIDAASHRGIDDVRALIEAVKLAPALARNKVYIIDEAHMLTLEASNALLKTLEEPPSHVFFILATTDPEKLIPTIRSRATVINFKKATRGEIVASLERKARGENIKFEKKALEVIASFSNGSFRDAAKILEQLIAEGVKLEFESVEKSLDKMASFNLEDVVKSLSHKNLDYLLVSIDKAKKEGIEMDLFLDKLLLRLREELLMNVNGKKDGALFEQSELIQLIELLIEAKREMFNLSEFEYLPIEIAFIKWCMNHISGGNSDETRVKKDAEKDNGLDLEVNNKKVENPVLPGNLVTEEMWRQILFQARKVNASVEALLRAVRPLNLDGEVLNLAVYYKFHKERLEEVRNKQVVEMIVSKVLNKPVRLVFSLTNIPDGVGKGKKNYPTSNDSNNEKKNLVDIAKNVFSD